MEKLNNVKINDWITLGMRDAVVCKIYNTSDKIEVVYLDDKNLAINEDAIFINGKWEYLVEGPTGGYADGKDRLAESVKILRAGRYR